MIKFLKQKKYLNIVIFLITMFFLLDRFLKTLSIKIEEDIVLIKNFLSFTFLPNKNISFSIPINSIFLKIILILLIVIVIFNIFLSIKQNEKINFIAWWSIFLGAVSNLWDRITYSYVIDYLDLRFFTVFNLSDCLIFLGSIIVIMGVFKKDDNKILN